MLKSVFERLSLQKIEYEMERADIPDIFFEIGYCGHPTVPYAHIQLKQATKLMISHIQEEYYPFIHYKIKNQKTQLVCLYFAYRLKKNSPRTDITNDNQKDYTFAPTYGYGSTFFTVIKY